MNITILCAERNELQAEKIKTILYNNSSDTTFSFRACPTLYTTISELKVTAYDVLLLSLELLDTNIRTAIETLHEIAPNTLIIILIDDSHVEVAKVTIRAGATAYVKSSDMSALPLVIILAIEKWGIERILEDRCALYDSIVNMSPDYICRFDPDYIITFANSAFCTLVTLPIDKVIGTRICDYLPSEIHERLHNCQHLTDSSCILTEENEFKVCGRWVSWRANAVHSRTGTIVEIQCVGRDTTSAHRKTQVLLQLARNRMCEQQQELNATVDKAFSTLLETDKLLSQMEGGVEHGRR
jgi:PAS domain S-box-containing protein